MCAKDSSTLLSILANLSHQGLGSSCPERSLQLMLDALIKHFECDRAWLLYPCEPSAKSWSVPIERTTTEFPGAYELGVSLPMTPEARGVFAACLRSKRPLAQDSRAQHPVPSDVQRAFQVKAQLSMVVAPQHGKPWLAGLHHCRSPRNWTEAEIETLLQASRWFAESLTNWVTLQRLEQDESEEREGPSEAQLDCSLSGHIEQVSDSVTEHLGYRPDALIGRSLLHYFSSTLERAVVWTKIHETGFCPSQEIGLVSATGEEVPCLFSARLSDDKIQIRLHRLSETESQTASLGPKLGVSSSRTLGRLQIDTDGHRISVAGRPVHLTATEFSLLSILTEQPGRVVPREHLLEQIWGVDFSGATRTVDSHIRNLRRKLKAAWPEYQPIRSVRGVGYSFEIDPLP